jgi:hypothetical protein
LTLLFRSLVYWPWDRGGGGLWRCRLCIMHGYIVFIKNAFLSLY